MRITEVRRGSPAAEAGIRPGDQLLAVNDLDRPDELLALSERLHLRAGDPVRMVVERDGRRHELRLRAAERPQEEDRRERVEFAFTDDAMVETMMRQMDSLKVQIVQSRSGDVRVRATAGTGSGSTTAGTGRGSSGAVVVTRDGRGVQAPFEFFVFRGEAHDSLRREMDEVNDLADELERRLELRERVLERRFGSNSPMRFARDDEVRRLRREMDELERRSTDIEVAMADAARQTAGFDYRWPAPPSPTATVPEPEATSWGAGASFRPLTPYMLGRNRVAGAEVIDLRPELAAYFEGVESGVLVVDVAPQTPAAISGLVPGDVITRMDQVVVRSVEDLRFGVSRAGEVLPLTLVRRGDPIQLLLRR